MPTLYLHIGRSKTGSTTIQYFADANRHALLRSGVLVPDIGYSHRQHFDLALALRNPDHPNAQQLLSDWQELLIKTQTDVFVSSEFLIGLKKPMIEALATAARSLRTVILVYIRDYPSLIVSTYNHATKKGRNVADFDSYYEKQKDQLSFISNVSNFADAFGWENIRIRSLDTLAAAGHGLELDLLTAIERPYLSELVNTGDDQHNASWPWTQVEFLRAVSDRVLSLPGMAIGKPLMRAVRPFLSRLDTTGRSKKVQYLTAEQCRYLQGLYNTDIAFINGKTGGQSVAPHNQQIGERPFLPSISALTHDELKRFSSKIDASRRLKEASPEVYQIIRSELATQLSCQAIGAAV